MRIHREGTLIIEIRKAEKADVPAILDLVRGKAEFDGCLNSLQSTEADIEEAFFSEQPKAFALLAMKSGEAVGIATYYSIYSTFIAKPGIWLDDLFVYPQFRGSGVGEALSQSCVSSLRILAAGVLTGSWLPTMIEEGASTSARALGYSKRYGVPG